MHDADCYSSWGASKKTRIRAISCARLRQPIARQRSIGAAAVERLIRQYRLTICCCMSRQECAGIERPEWPHRVSEKRFCVSASDIDQAMPRWQPARRALHHETDNLNIAVVVDGYLPDRHRCGRFFQRLSNPIARASQKPWIQVVAARLGARLRRLKLDRLGATCACLRCRKLRGYPPWSVILSRCQSPH